MYTYKYICTYIHIAVNKDVGVRLSRPMVGMINLFMSAAPSMVDLQIPISCLHCHNSLNLNSHFQHFHILISSHAYMLVTKRISVYTHTQT